MKLLVFTSTRADYGILRSLLAKLEVEPSITASLLVTGTHLSYQHGMTVSEIIEDGFRIAERVKIPVESDNWESTLKTMAGGFEAFGPALRRSSPDLVLILGDRFEAFVFASVCHVARVPIAHLHGGEVTLGAIDDSFRHSITKFSSLHLVAAEEFAQRVIQLGEDPDTVKNVGAVGLDTIRDELASHQTERSDTVLVTHHPVTIGGENAIESLQSILDGLLLGNFSQILVTRPNIDSEAKGINQLLDSYQTNDRIQVHQSLGSKRYLRELAGAALVVGNSSSGLIEAPFLGTPVVNVGDRQNGRPRDKIVLDLPMPTPELVLEAATQAITMVREPFATTVYGDGRSADRCVREIVLQQLPPDPKRFHDLTTA